MRHSRPKTRGEEEARPRQSKEDARLGQEMSEEIALHPLYTCYITVLSSRLFQHCIGMPNMICPDLLLPLWEPQCGASILFLRVRFWIVR